MLAEIGLIAAVFAFIAAVYAIIAAVYGERFARSEAMVRSARNAVILNFILVTVACLCLEVALMTEQYQISYVWMVSSPDMPTIYRLTALTIQT